MLQSTSTVVANGREITSSTGFTSYVLMENGVAVATVTDVNLSAATVNALLDNAAGVDPYGDAFITFLGPLFSVPLTVTGSTGNDIIYGSTTNDTINAGAGDDYIRPRGGFDLINGGAGLRDHADFRDLSAPIEVDLRNNSVSNHKVSIHTNDDPIGTIAGVEWVTGTAFDDMFWGTDEDEAFFAGGGADRIRAGGGNDYAEGMQSNDYFDMGAGFDVVGYGSEAYAGATRGIIANLSSSPVSANVGAGTQTAGSEQAIDSLGGLDTFFGVEGIIGTRFTDLLVGSDEANYLNGAGGYDMIDGLGGNDRLEPGAGGGYVLGGTGYDTGVLAGSRADFRLIELGEDDLRLIDLRSGAAGEKTAFQSVEYFEFTDVHLAASALIPDAFSGRTSDTGGIEYGIHTTGELAYGWHWESGWDYGHYHDGFSWYYGWYVFSGLELGWFGYGSQTAGWYYDYGGIGEGWIRGYGSGGNLSAMYGSWTPPAPSWPQGYGYSFDYGSATLGTYRSGGDYVYGTHYEYGWDYGVYGTGTGWVTGWFYHAGWEVGWYQTGAWTYGWYWDFGGYGSGWYLGAAQPYSYAGTEY